MRFFTAIWVIVLVLVYGCSAPGLRSHARSVENPPLYALSLAEMTKQFDQDTVLAMERTICFGTCPAYELLIFGDGTVVFEGKRYVKQPGRWSYRVGLDVVASLIAAFRQADFFSLDLGVDGDSNSIFTGADCYTCASSVILSIRLGDEYHQVDHYLGCTGFPGEDELLNLEGAIDSMLNVRKWIE